MECRNCNGTGIVPASEWDADKALLRDNYQRRAEQCPDCLGKGEAPRPLDEKGCR